MFSISLSRQVYAIFADDNSPYFAISTSAITWFEANYMRLNSTKCHVLWATLLDKKNSVHKGEESFRWVGPIVGDATLPDNIKTISDLEKFKKVVKGWVPANCV